MRAVWRRHANEQGEAQRRGPELQRALYQEPRPEIDDDEEPYDEVFDKGLGLGARSSRSNAGAGGATGAGRSRRNRDNQDEDGGIPDGNVEVPSEGGLWGSARDGGGSGGGAAADDGTGVIAGSRVEKTPRVTPWGDRARALVQKARCSAHHSVPACAAA